MERYYDAHLYFANWGSRHLLLKLPAAVLNAATAERYAVDPVVEVWSHGGNTILSFTSEDEELEWEDHLEGVLAVLVGVRAELAAGDMRALYLAWLAGIGTRADDGAFVDELDGRPSPPLPVGLSALTGPQQALTEFLRLDSGLLARAADARPGI